MYLIILLSGFLGGVVRGLIGFLKHKFSYKNVPFDMLDFLGTVFISGIVGVVSAAAIKEVGFTLDNYFTPALSFIVGYAGGDFIENIYKLIIQRSSLYKDKEEK